MVNKWKTCEKHVKSMKIMFFMYCTKHMKNMFFM